MPSTTPSRFYITEFECEVEYTKNPAEYDVGIMSEYVEIHAIYINNRDAYGFFTDDQIGEMAERILEETAPQEDP